MLLEHWAAIESDLADVGIDLGDTALMEARSLRWLDTRILGLLDRPALIEPWTGRVQYLTRLQNAVWPQSAGGKTAEK